MAQPPEPDAHTRSRRTRESAGLFAAEAAAPGLYVRVAVERGIDRLPTSGDGSLTYRIDDTTLGSSRTALHTPAVPPVSIGQRVKVPLGKAATPTDGIVVELGDESLAGDMDPSRVRSIIRIREEIIPADIIALARWMATYYVCPLGMVLASMLPAAVKKGTGTTRVEVGTLAWLEAPEGVKLRASQRRVLGAIAALPEGDRTGPWPLKSLARLLGLKSVAPLRRLAEIGALSIAEHAEVVARSATPSNEHQAPLGQTALPDLQLTHDQAHAIAAITAKPQSGPRPFGVHLLRGVTGSGKTEVYLQALARVLDDGLSAIVLVPEIALTPQTAERFTRRFGEANIAVMHSGLSASQRHHAWARAAGGDARIVVGARSAVFAPVRSLGLVVVDEEHDSSYKQDRLPRYNARDAAIKRAQLAGCPVVLGSATPSLESWHNATSPVAPGKPPRFSLLELPTRVPGACLPDVEILDLARERALRAHREGLEDRRIHLIGPTLETAIEATLSSGGQIMLLLNRRGFAHYVSCVRGSCPFVLSCDQCDARLVLHQHEGLPLGGFVRCHHCLAEQRVPRMCPICKGRIHNFGGGTQRAEDELVRKFGSLGIALGDTLLRLDSDTMRSARDYHEALARFSRGDARILLGTQMISKGLDVANVRLVGVLDADTALAIPDFRATERTFQLVSQVAGRAGRGHLPGRVLIQTHEPNHPAIKLAAQHDYTTFANAELAIRTRSSLPPTRRMARIVSRDTNESKAREAATLIAAALREAAESSLEVRGPIPCAVSRIANHYRFAIDALAPAAGTLQRALAHARARGLLRSDTKTAIDVDPVALM